MTFTWMNRSSSFARVAIIFSISVVASAQNYMGAGIVAGASYAGGNVDHVNLASGNLFVSIPFISFPQKGILTLNGSLVQNSSVWGLIPEYYGTPLDVKLMGAGNMTLTWDGFWSGGVQSYANDGNCGGGSMGFLADTMYIYGSDGSVHSEAIKSSGSTFSGSPICPGSGYSAETTDGTGITFVLTRPPLNGYGNMLLYDRKGIIYEQNNGQNAGASDYLYAKDPDGNLITSDTTTIHDSVGRAIPVFPFGNQLPQPPAVSTVGCVGPRPTLTAYNWTIPGPNGQNLTYKICIANVVLQTRFNQPGWVDFANGGNSIMQSILLPNGQSWIFEFADQTVNGVSANYGELTKITLPSGGSISYTYQTIITTASGERWPNRVVKTRAINAADGTADQVWTYQWQPNGYAGGGKHIQVVITDPNQNDTAHWYNGYGAFGGGAGEEVETDYYTGSFSSGVLLKSETIDYLITTAPSYATSVFVQTAPAILPIRKTTTLSNGLVSKEETDYDSGVGIWPGGTHGNVIQKRSYSFGQGSSGPLTSTTSNTYYAFTNPAYLNANFLDLVATTTLSNSAGSTIIQSSIGYDENNGSPQGVLGHATSTATTPSVGSAVTTGTVYNSQGMPIATINGNGNQTNITYDDTGIFPRQVQQPATSGVTHSLWYTHDSVTGQITSSTDQNASGIGDLAHTTTYSYDIFGRPVAVQYPDGGGSNRCYTDTGGATCSKSNTSPYLVVKTVAQNTGTNTVSSEKFDGIGRVIQVQINSSPNGAIYADTVYDGLNRPITTSNPYISKNDTSYGTSHSMYDALGRMTRKINIDGSSTQWCYDGLPDPIANQNNCMSRVGTSLGSWVDISDETGSHQQQITDSMGRMIAVIEPGALETDYHYDPLGNLLNLTQIGLPGTTPSGFLTPETSKSRSFTYDSLSRLLSSTNPETGTICYGITTDGGPPNATGSNCSPQYGYDANGNLLTKTDANGTQLHFLYDALNRPTNKFSADGLVNDAYYYDNTGLGPNEIGRLSVADHYGIASNGFSYDAMGRVTGTSYAAPGSGGWQGGMGVSYDLAGNPTTINYPDGRSISQTFDAAGRLATVSSGTTTYFSANPSAGPMYTPAGAEQNILLGNGVTEATQYNSRLQPCHAMATTPILPANPAVGNLLDRQSFYGQALSSPCGSEAANNGNIWAITDNLNVGWSQGFGYDSLNRLTTANRSDGGYNHTYNYDSFGNMLVQDNLHGNPAWSIDQATNRLMLGASYVYDNAGNLTSMPNGLGLQSYQYTALNQIYAVDGGSTALYDYNGLDERAFKQTPNGWTDYIYLNGQPMSEQTNTGLWTDYIYANGKKIAKVDSAAPAWHLSGTGTGESNCGAQFWVTGTATPLAGLPLLPGDRLVVDMKAIGAHMDFLLLVDSNLWINTVDQDGYSATDYARTDGTWHHRIIDLSAWAGHAVTALNVGIQQFGPAGQDDVWMRNAAIVRAGGSVLPIFNGSPVSMTGWYGTVLSATPVDTCVVSGLTLDFNSIPLDDTVNTTYYLDDHLGTAQMELTSGGWPVWQGQFTPFGAELPDGNTAMHYKFTGKERDTESGLDYFGARYYASNMGRWMSPDWSSNPISIPFARIDNPQTMNLYAYVGNNPLRRFDSNGHLDCSGGALQDVACAVTAAAKSAWHWLTSGGSSDSSSSQSSSVSTSQQDNYTPEQMGQPNVFSSMKPNRAPDFYSASLQLGYAAPSLSYMPSTKNVFTGPSAAGPHGFGLMLTAGWSKRPENFLSGSSLSGCGYFVAAACVGSSLTSFTPTLQLGVNIGPPGGSLSGGYNLDWNSYTQSLYDSLPVSPTNTVPAGGTMWEDPNMGLTPNP